MSNGLETTFFEWLYFRAGIVSYSLIFDSWGTLPVRMCTLSILELYFIHHGFPQSA